LPILVTVIYSRNVIYQCVLASRNIPTGEVWVLTGDKGYDSRPLVTELWDAYRIKPVIDIRNMWKDGEISHVLPGYDHVPYDSKGVVACDDPATGIKRTMANGGFEQDRSTLKKVCSGGVCEGAEECPVKHQLRIK